MQSPTTHSNALTVEIKVIMTLFFLATGKMQRCSSDDVGPLQSTKSCVINTTLLALTASNVVRQFIDFPTDVQTTQGLSSLLHKIIPYNQYCSVVPRCGRKKVARQSPQVERQKAGVFILACLKHRKTRTQRVPTLECVFTTPCVHEHR